VLVLDARRPLEAESNPDVAKEPKSDRQFVEAEAAQFPGAPHRPRRTIGHVLVPSLLSGFEMRETRDACKKEEREAGSPAAEVAAACPR
jgi:hypothetical protein